MTTEPSGPRALVFDCDGVLADTERNGHLPAFNQTFRELDVPVQWSDAEYARKVRIGGGKERMASLLTPEFVAANDLPSDPDGQRELLATWHRRKTEIYTALVADGALPPRPGVDRLAEEALDAGWALAVASTSAEPSVRAVLEHAVGTTTAARFTVLAGDVVPHKKPAPDIYLLTLERLGVPAPDTVVIEDSAGGLRAALSARLRTVVTVSAYTADEDFSGASLVVDSLGDPDVPVEVLADPLSLGSLDLVTLGTLEAVLASPRPPRHEAAPPPDAPPEPEARPQEDR